MYLQGRFVVATITSRDFNQDVSAAKRSAASEPVIITDRGRPSHVLLSIEEYRRLVADQRSIVDWLSVDDDVDLVVEPMNLSLSVPDL
jgi:prevent-host-death family protein